MCGHNNETVNWLFLITKNMADVTSIAPWSDDSLCTMTGSQPPVTEREILDTTSSDKKPSQLKKHIREGFPETKAELQTDLQPYWRVKDMLSVYEGVVYMGIVLDFGEHPVSIGKGPWRGIPVLIPDPYRPFLSF